MPDQIPPDLIEDLKEINRELGQIHEMVRRTNMNIDGIKQDIHLMSNMSFNEFMSDGKTFLDA